MLDERTAFVVEGIKTWMVPHFLIYLLMLLHKKEELWMLRSLTRIKLLFNLFQHLQAATKWTGYIIWSQVSVLPWQKVLLISHVCPPHCHLDGSVLGWYQEEYLADAEPNQDKGNAIGQRQVFWSVHSLLCLKIHIHNWLVEFGSQQCSWIPHWCKSIT